MIKSRAMTHFSAGETERFNDGFMLVSAVGVVAVFSVLLASGVVGVWFGRVSSVSGVDKIPRSE